VAGLRQDVFKREMLDIIHARFTPRSRTRVRQRARRRLRVCGRGGQIGIIGSVTEPFCSSCTEHGSPQMEICHLPFRGNRRRSENENAAGCSDEELRRSSAQSGLTGAIATPICDGMVSVRSRIRSPTRRLK
jgi:hypothetical protein